MSRSASARAGSVWSLAALALLAAGLLVRAALYFPLAMYQVDSDAVIAGLCAFRVAGGQHPAFLPGGSRVGAASCYVAAGYFQLFGAGRLGLALTALTWGLLYLVFSWLFFRAALGRKTACLALLFAAVPAEQFMTVTYAPWGYGEIMASCAATLWLAALWRNEGKLWQRLCFGISVGLGVWFSLQTLMIALPAILWVALKRRAVTARDVFPSIVGAVAGAAVFLLANVASGFPTFTRNWASQPAPGAAQAWSNFVWLMSYLLPKLFFRSGGWWSETTLFIAACAAIALGFAAAMRRGERLDAGQLLLFAFLSCALLFTFSAAGALRGWTVRYVAPLYVVAPVFIAIGTASLWRSSKVVAAVAVLALTLPNLLLYGLPGSAARSDLTIRLRDENALRDGLAGRGVQMLYGNYDWVYSLNFDSRERIAAVPFAPNFDYMGYGAGLGTTPVRWALLGGENEVRAWARAAGARGTMSRDGDLWVFVSDTPATNAARLLATLRGVE